MRTIDEVLITLMAAGFALSLAACDWIVWPAPHW